MHPIKYCSTREDIEDAVRDLETSSELYLDMEGKDLGRDGSLSLIQIFSGKPGSNVYVFDVFVNPDAPSLLRPLLESRNHEVFTWDPRADSDVLYHQYGGIKMERVICLQLAETALDRQHGLVRAYVHGLGKVLEQHLPSSVAFSAAQIKKEGRAIMSEDNACFTKRPLPESLIQYAANDIAFLPDLKKQIWSYLSPHYRSWVTTKSRERVEMAWRLKQMPKGMVAARAPK